MLEKLNNLALLDGNARPLDQKERAAILEKLQFQASMSWQGVRGALRPIFKARGEPGREKSIRFNLEEGGDPKLLGNVVEAKLAAIFASGWPNHPYRQAIRDAVHERLWAADYRQIGEHRVVILFETERKRRRAEAAQSFIADFGITEDQALSWET
jgi:CRISPR-associated endonuclease Csn1